MVMSIARFNCVQPGVEPQEMAKRYQAFVDMAEYADQHGFAMVTLEEHHGAENGWSPSPLVMAGLVFGRCKNIGISLSALLVPLHDPLRIAEDLAVLDLASGGRMTTPSPIEPRSSRRMAVRSSRSSTPVALKRSSSRWQRVASATSSGSSARYGSPRSIRSFWLDPPPGGSVIARR